jgi:hypothetical protein
VALAFFLIVGRLARLFRLHFLRTVPLTVKNYAMAYKFRIFKWNAKALKEFPAKPKKASAFFAGYENLFDPLRFARRFGARLHCCSLPFSRRLSREFVAHLLCRFLT